MHHVVVSFLTALLVVGSLFYLWDEQAQALELHAVADEQQKVPAMVQEVIRDRADIGHGSNFSPMWKRERIAARAAMHEATKPDESETEVKTQETPERNLRSSATPQEQQAEPRATEEPVVTAAAPSVEEVSESEPPAEREASAPDADAAFVDALVRAVHERTNRERTHKGLAPLERDPALARIAETYSKDMIERDFFAHETPDGCDLYCRFEAAGYEARAWGENIAWRREHTMRPAEELAEYFVDRWMGSSGHRRNILSEQFTHEGIGVVRVKNTVYITVDFAEQK